MAGSKRTPIDPDKFPQNGFFRVNEFTSNRGHRGILQWSKNTFLARVADGTYPPAKQMDGVNFWRAEHIRAIAEGRDWREAPVPELT